MLRHVQPAYSPSLPLTRATRGTQAGLKLALLEIKPEEIHLACITETWVSLQEMWPAPGFSVQHQPKLEGQGRGVVALKP